MIVTDFICSINPVGHLNFLLLLGIAVVGGTIGAKVFQRFHFPQVVGYIIIGLIIGQSGFKLVNSSVVDSFEPLNYFALGIIGFMIGGELKFEVFRKYGRQFTAILLGEGLGAFAIVGTTSTLLSYLFTKDIRLSVALGVVLGAISSATDPASTIQVLWEYKTRGPLTTSTVAVVALDDVLALTLYAIGTSVAGVLTGKGQIGLAGALGHAGYEIGIALVLGCFCGLLLFWCLLKLHEPDTSLTFTVGAVLVVLGLSIALNIDIILSSMTLGLTLVNCAPRRTEKAFDLIRRFAPPIYVLFFVLVGARLKVFGMSTLALSLVVVYILGRSIGKIAGAYWGTVISKGPQIVKKHLGKCLFAQGGVAIGLSILASHRFDNDISSIVILVVASTTFIVQLAGPVFVKHSVKKAGEVNMNITEQGLIDTFKVADVIDRDRVTIKGNATLDEIITTFGKTRFTYYPVVDDHEKLIGVITIEGIRSTLADTKASNWLLAMDIMSPIVYNVTPDMPLADVLKKARDINLDHIPVIRSEEDTYCLGILDLRIVKRYLSAEVLSRQQKTDTIQTV